MAEDVQVRQIVQLVLPVQDADIVAVVELVASVVADLTEKALRKASLKKNKSPDSYRSSKPHTGNPPKVFIDKGNINLNSNNRYIASVATTNVYEKPTFKSKIITTVPKNVKLIKLSKEGSWYKVQVKTSGKVGFVFNKDVK